MAASDYLPLVKTQYEALPYPPRDPADERRRLIHLVGDNLITLNHHCFGGAHDFRHSFRVLIAGGGTGDSTIYLAEQLRDFGAQIVYVDLSAASMAVAQERARVRGLDNIRWLNASIMNLPEFGLGEFDYISCTGVLHHLESTEAGLAVLERLLKPRGVIYLMLYARYGRRSVYDMQELLRDYLPPTASMAEKIRMTRALLAALPASNTFSRDRDRWRHEIGPEGFGDTGLYDLLLHSQDRCFDVPEIYALADSAGLDLLAFVDRAVAYEPRTHLKSGCDARHLDTLDGRRRQAVAELMTSDLIAHEFYLGHRGVHRAASFDDERNALVLAGAMHGRQEEIGASLAPGRMVQMTGARSGTLTIVGNEVNRVFFSLMDAVTPLVEVYARVHAVVPGVGMEQLREGLRQTYETLHAHGHVHLLQAGSYGVKVPDYGRMQPA